MECPESFLLAFGGGDRGGGGGGGVVVLVEVVVVGMFVFVRACLARCRKAFLDVSKEPKRTWLGVCFVSTQRRFLQPARNVLHEPSPAQCVS